MKTQLMVIQKLRGPNFPQFWPPTYTHTDRNILEDSY